MSTEQESFTKQVSQRRLLFVNGTYSHTKVPCGMFCKARTPQPFLLVLKSWSLVLEEPQTFKVNDLLHRMSIYHFTAQDMYELHRSSTSEVTDKNFKYLSPFCTTRFLQVLQQEHAWLHSKMRGGFSRQNSGRRRPLWTGEKIHNYMQVINNVLFTSCEVCSSAFVVLCSLQYFCPLIPIKSCLQALIGLDKYCYQKDCAVS